MSKYEELDKEIIRRIGSDSPMKLERIYSGRVRTKAIDAVGNWRGYELVSRRLQALKHKGFIQCRGGILWRVVNKETKL